MTDEFGPEGNDSFTYAAVPCECLEHFFCCRKRCLTKEVSGLKDKISLNIFKVLKAELLNEDHSNI